MMNTPSPQRNIAPRAMAAVAVLFGLLTIKEGGAVLLGHAPAVAAAGAYVPFVLWFNVLAGFAYVIAGVGLWQRCPWAVGLAVAIAAATALTFAALGVHVALGGAYERRTVGAMLLRTTVWTVIAALSWRTLRRRC
jgi:hypothetical protein